MACAVALIGMHCNKKKVILNHYIGYLSCPRVIYDVLSEVQEMLLK